MALLGAAELFRAEGRGDVAGEGERRLAAVAGLPGARAEKSFEKCASMELIALEFK